MVDLYFISVVLFFVIIALVIYADRKKIDTQYYILFMRRTKRFRDIIDSAANISPRFWKAAYTLGVLVCVYYMLQGTYYLFNIAYLIATGAVSEPAVQLILPTASSVGSSGPGYILIPFWFWIITIAVILVPHEFSHGVIARAEKVKLKSVGLLLLAIFPGAFVEPDDRSLKRASFMAKLRIFAAGSAMNFLIAVAVLALISYVVWPAVSLPGVELIEIADGSPAAAAGLVAGQTITHANGVPVTTSYQEYFSGSGYFGEEVGRLKSGETLTFTADGKDYSVTVASKDNRPHIGIIYRPFFSVDPDAFLGSWVPLLTMVWLFSFAIGVVNILPIGPLDGGQLFRTIADRFLGKNSKKVVRVVNYVLLFVILYDFIVPIL